MSRSDVTLGTKAEAEAAARGELPFVGSGAFRKVFRSPSGDVVYKVDQSADSYMNYDEVERWRRHCDDAQWGHMLAPICAYEVPRDVEVRDGQHFVLSGRACDKEGCKWEGKVNTEFWREWHNESHVEHVMALVVAMPFMPKAPQGLTGEEYRDCRDVVDEAAYCLGIGDMHDGNWRCDANGQPYIVDYAGFNA